MTSIASQFLIARFKGLYEEREEKGKVIIVSSDHQEFRVHSLVLMIRSNILGTQGDCSPDFQERERKTVKLPFPATALGLLVDFLYGLQIRLGLEESNLSQVQTLIEMGTLYAVPGLEDAVSVCLEKILSKDSVFSILSFCQQHNAQVAVTCCAKFVAKSFPTKTLIEDGTLTLYPEVAFQLVVIQDEKSDSLENMMTSNMSVYEKTLSSIIFDNGSDLYSYSLQMKTNSPINLTGIGLFLSPGSQVTLTIKLGYYHDDALIQKMMWSSVLERSLVTNKTSDRTVPVMFRSKFKMEAEQDYSLLVEIHSGSGASGALGVNTETLRRFRFEAGKARSRAVRRTAAGNDKEGVLVDLVEFTLSDEDHGQIPHLYFYLQHDMKLKRADKVLMGLRAALKQNTRNFS